jgi:translation initiation factor 1
MKPNSLTGGLVYSTESGRMCPDCRNPIDGCTCKSKAVDAKSDGIVRISYETKGRGGKGVTVVKGFALVEVELAAMGKQLKTACGTGGTVKDSNIEIQGDHCERIMSLLKAKGFVVKRSGG